MVRWPLFAIEVFLGGIIVVALSCGGSDGGDESEAEAEGESEGESESESEAECAIDDDCNSLDDPATCATGSCEKGACVASSCNDGSTCTEDACDGAGMCEYAPHDSATSSPEAGIPDEGSVSNTITASGTDVLLGLAVTVDIDHTYAGDLIITVTHVDTGSSATLLSLPDGGSGDNGSNLDGVYAFADGGLPFPTDCGDSCVIPSMDVYEPYTSLGVFTGESIAGDWTIDISDNAFLDTGTLHSWTVFFIIPCDDGDAGTTGDACIDGTCTGQT